MGEEPVLSWSAAEDWDIDTQRFRTVGIILDVAKDHPAILQAKQTLREKKLILDVKKRGVYGVSP